MKSLLRSKQQALVSSFRERRGLVTFFVTLLIFPLLYPPVT
jgi:hypothetical protein